jgi:hypothetical protein
MSGVLIHMADHQTKYKSWREIRRNKNDPLQSPLVAQTRKLVATATAKAIENHQTTVSTEQAIAAGAYAAGLADAMVMLEWVAVELAKKVGA